MMAQTETQLPYYGQSEFVGNSSPNYSYPNSKAHWDLQMSFSATDSTNGDVGMAGVAFYNNEFWVARWQYDTLYRFDINGSLISEFVIAGLTGTRSITTDGTYLYMGTNTNTIYRVNPTTQLLAPPHITSSSVNTSRFLTYDPTLDGGSGGFWTGNFNTDIDAISMSGAVLSTIPATTHTLTGMYGAAIDNISTGGPYLWVFHQGGLNSCQMTALKLPAGTPTLYDYDLFTSIGSTYGLITGSLAGGAFITTQLVSGQTSLIGCIQGNPDNVIFAFEIDPSPFSDDVEVTSVKPTLGYSQIPSTQVFSETFSIGYRNAGASTIDTLYADVEYLHNGSLISSETVFATLVASAGTGTLTTTGFLPANGTGTYTVAVTVRPNASITDTDPSNDTLSFNFAVTDSVFARDNGIPNGGSGYAVSSIDWAYAAAMYELTNADTLGGIWIQLATPVQDDTTYAVVYNMAGGIPTTEIALGEVTIIDSTINTYYLQFATPIALAAGTYAFGCYEGANTTINLAQSASIFTPGTNFFYISSSGWTASGIMTARFIHPILTNSQSNIGFTEMDKNAFVVFPVPATENITVAFANTTSMTTQIQIADIAGRIVYSEQVPAGTLNLNISLSNLNSGTYILSWNSGAEQHFDKIIIE